MPAPWLQAGISGNLMDRKFEIHSTRLAIHIIRKETSMLTDIHPTRPDRVFGKRLTALRAAVAAGAAVLALGGTALTLGAGTASAQTLTDVYSPTTLVASSDWLNIAVSGGSTSAGAPVIQWWADGGGEQQWYVPNKGASGEIINVNSNMCVTTDGTAGDTLTQEPCTESSGQIWTVSTLFDSPQTYLNPASGLVMDVYGYDMWAGGNIDAWYGNGAPNQYFFSSTDY